MSETLRAATGRAGKGGELRRLAVRGSAWILGGQVAGQGLRLVSSLLLTRLLSPDLFGLIALAQLVNRGVAMFSDVGLRGNVVHHERGDDPRRLGLRTRARGWSTRRKSSSSSWSPTTNMSGSRIRGPTSC